MAEYRIANLVVVGSTPTASLFMKYVNTIAMLIFKFNLKNHEMCLILARSERVQVGHYTCEFETPCYFTAWHTGE